jgi:hypothetical protein
VDNRESGTWLVRDCTNIGLNGILQCTDDPIAFVSSRTDVFTILSTLPFDNGIVIEVELVDARPKSCAASGPWRDHVHGSISDPVAVIGHLTANSSNRARDGEGGRTELVASAERNRPQPVIRLY